MEEEKIAETKEPIYKKFLNAKLLIIVGLVLIVVLAGSWFFWHKIAQKKQQAANNQAQTQTQTQNPTEQNTPAEITPEVIFSAMLNAIVKKDANECNALENKVFEGEDFKKVCLIRFYRISLIRGDNVEESLEQLKAFGESNLTYEAGTKKDVSICDKIDNILEKNTCKATTTSDEKQCLINKWDEKDQVKSSVCFSIKDGKLTTQECSIGKDENEKLCLGSFYMFKAIRENNFSYCDQIDDYAGFAKEVCTALSGKNTSK